MLIYEELSKKVINAYYNVQRILGKGYILNFSQQEGLGVKRLLGLSARSEE